MCHQKSEKCISGIATTRKHSFPTQSKGREEKRALVYQMINIKCAIKKVKNASQEMPQPESTVSPHSQKVERKGQHSFIK
jgi:hypothetical protein